MFKTLPANVRIGWKGSPGTKILAFLAASSVMKKKCLMTITPRDNVFKLFYL
jgi:hypothetical protein